MRVSEVTTAKPRAIIVFIDPLPLIGLTARSRPPNLSGLRVVPSARCRQSRGCATPEYVPVVIYINQLVHRLTGGRTIQYRMVTRCCCGATEDPRYAWLGNNYKDDREGGACARRAAR